MHRAPLWIVVHKSLNTYCQRATFAIGINVNVEVGK